MYSERDPPGFSSFIYIWMKTRGVERTTPFGLSIQAHIFQCANVPDPKINANVFINSFSFSLSLSSSSCMSHHLLLFTFTLLHFIMTFLSLSKSYLFAFLSSFIIYSQREMHVHVLYGTMFRVNIRKLIAFMLLTIFDKIKRVNEPELIFYKLFHRTW